MKHMGATTSLLSQVSKMDSCAGDEAYTILAMSESDSSEDEVASEASSELDSLAFESFLTNIGSCIVRVLLVR